MSTSSLGSLLSSLAGSSAPSLDQLLGLSSTSTSTSSTAQGSEAIQSAVNAILNSATNTSGTGIDVTTTVNSILQIDAQPEINLDARVSALNVQSSALQTLQSDIGAVQTSLQSLTDFSGDFGGLAVASTNNNVVSATAVNGTLAGTHTVSVSKLASISAEYSAAFTSGSSLISNGSLTLTVGTNTPATIPVDSADGTNTLAGLASYINSNNLGVTASVITDSSGARLALVSQTSGVAGQMTLTDQTAAEQSGAFATAATALPAGSFDLQVGANAAVTIPVDTADGTNTLTGLASYINQQKLGVTASVETSAAGAQLDLVPQNAGAAGVLNITNDTTGTGNGLGFATAQGGGLGFTVAATGKDAALTVDGIPIDSASNTVAGAIPGVTLTLSGLTTTGVDQTDSPVTLQVSPNLAPIGADVNTFVSNWNSMITAINSSIQVNASTGGTGVLIGDTSVDFVQQQLLSALSSSTAGNGTLSNLQSIGIEFQNDGTLSVNSSVLNAALQNNFAGVQNLFQASSGVGQSIQKSLTSLTDPVSGALNVDIKGLANQVTDLNSQISDFQLQLQQTQKQLLNEYTIINTTLEQLPQTLAQINSQLNALNPTKSG